MPNDAYECSKVLLNAKIVIESDLCANFRIFALMNISSHYESLFHANDCVFSRNEQKKGVLLRGQKLIPQPRHGEV